MPNQNEWLNALLTESLDRNWKTELDVRMLNWPTALVSLPELPDHMKVADLQFSQYSGHIEMKIAGCSARDLLENMVEAAKAVWQMRADISKLLPRMRQKAARVNEAGKPPMPSLDQLHPHVTRQVLARYKYKPSPDCIILLEHQGVYLEVRPSGLFWSFVAAHGSTLSLETPQPAYDPQEPRFPVEMREIQVGDPGDTLQQGAEPNTFNFKPPIVNDVIEVVEQLIEDVEGKNPHPPIVE